MPYIRTRIFGQNKVYSNIALPHELLLLQVQSLASFCSTILGTVVRIPCEVLKQRLQAGIFDNVGEAIVGTMQKDGIRGFFRGTGATLCREVPFYVAGMCLYGEAKKVSLILTILYVFSPCLEIGIWRSVLCELMGLP
jgi:phosphatidylinositol phospholipase C delta